MKKNFLSLLFFISTISFSLAQPGETDMPKNGQAGKCYAKCQVLPNPIIDEEKMSEAKLERQAYFIYMAIIRVLTQQ